MKILMVGSAKSFAIEASYKKHLEKWAEVNLFEAHDLFLAYYSTSTLNKLVFRLGFSSILQRINKKLLAVVSANRPNLVWVFKGMEIYPETLKKINSLGIVMVNYNADDPFDYNFKGSGNNNVKNSLKLYDHHFSYSKRIVERFRKELQIESSWLPFAYNVSKPPPITVKHSAIVCFIGNGDLNRAHVLQYLARSGLQVHVYGIYWEKFITKHENIKIFKSVMNDELTDTAQNYYCQVNIFRPQNVNSHNMRTFEMPALGCVMFAPSSKEHLLFFEEGKEAFFYSSKEELALKIRAFFQMDEGSKMSISKSAYRKCIDEKYSYVDRAATVYKVFSKLVEKVE